MSSNQQPDSDIANALRELAKEVGVAVERGRRTCVHCIHFDHAAEVCMLADTRPPARVIAFGCPRFGPDIPF